MRTMSDENGNQRKKPDGSAYQAHLAAIAERNAASKRAARAKREEYELGRVRDRREAERLQDAALSGKG